jgi:hypothetical protein
MMEEVLTEDELRAVIKKEVEQEFIQSFREGVLRICSTHENKDSRVANEKVILMKIKDIVSGYFDSHQVCLHIIEELVDRITSIVSEFKKEIKSKIKLSSENYRDGFALLEMNLFFSRRHQIQQKVERKPVGYSNIVLVKGGVEVSVSQAFALVVGGYVGPDEQLKKFFLDICATKQDQLLFICLYSVFAHFSRFTTNASNPRSNNKTALKNNKFLGLLLNESLKDFFDQKTDGFCKSYPFEGKVNHRTRLSALEKCKVEIDRLLIASSRTDLTHFSLVFTQALDDSLMSDKEEYHEKVFCILRAFLLRNIGDFVRSVDDLTDDEKVKLVGDKTIKKYANVPTDHKHRVEKLFPEAYGHGRTFQQDIEAGESSIIASYFWKYARRGEGGQEYTPMGDFISGIIWHKQISNDTKLKLVAMYLLDTVEHLLTLKAKGKFRKSALIGCIIRAMMWFERDPAVILRYLGLPTDNDKNKSFGAPDRIVFLENHIKPFLSAILGPIVIALNEGPVRVQFSSNILPNTLTKEQRKELLDLQLAYHQVEANPSHGNLDEFREKLERCNGDTVATINNFHFANAAVKEIVQQVHEAINPVQPQLPPVNQLQPQQQLESQPQAVKKGGGLFGWLPSSSRRNSGAESVVKQEKQTSSGNSSPVSRRRVSVGDDSSSLTEQLDGTDEGLNSSATNSSISSSLQSGSFKKAENLSGLMFDPDRGQFDSGKDFDASGSGGLRPDVLAELSKRLGQGNK